MSCLNVPPEIRPHAVDVEFWLIPLSNVKATMYYTVQFFRVPCNKKLCLDKWHEILIGTIRQVRNAKKLRIPTTEI